MEKLQAKIYSLVNVQLANKVCAVDIIDFTVIDSSLFWFGHTIVNADGVSLKL